MNRKEKIAPLTEFYKQVVFADIAFDVNYKEVSKVLFNEIDRLNSIIDKANEYIEKFRNNNTNNLDRRLEKLLEILGGKENE